MGFFTQNAVASLVGIVSGTLTHLALPDAGWVTIATISASGYLGVHLPYIQQPSLPSYRILRFASWLATLLVPLAIFAYRPTDLLPAWLISVLLTAGIWSLIDRISLQRDYTHSVMGIILLPLLVTGCAYLALGQSIVLPVFIACSVGYILQLLLEQRSLPIQSQHLTSAQDTQESET